MTAPGQPAKHILVVDDEPLVCEAVRMMLSFDGHTVDTVASAQAALDALEKTQYDVVVSDYAMPSIKGDELARRIKARNPKQPVILITAYAEMLQFSGNPLNGVDHVISKPFLLENLREALARATNPKPAAGK